MKNYTSSLAFLFLISVFSSLRVSAQNLIVNADFTSGNSGFISDYVFYNAGSVPVVGVQKAYGTVTNSNLWFPAFSSCIDHTTGLGNMMVVDGSTSNAANNKLWEQTVTVTPGKSYEFSYFLQSLTVGIPARIEILINGVSIGSPSAAPAAPCNWAQSVYNWNSGISSSAIITIYDREISGAGNDFAIDDLSFTACPDAPIVATPIYLCQNSPTIPLTATASVGSTLIWYGTSSSGGIPSPAAPTPSTTAVGATTYYVSQTDGICESPRSAIVVNVVADNGATILGLRCDPSQILPADINTSVFFDWSNNVLINDNSYNYSYTIQGGPPVTGTRIVSNLPLIGMLLPGQSATIILTATRFPCAPPQTVTCTVPCGVTTTPNFAAIAPFCTGTPAPILTNTSPNMITGTWLPAIISNTTSGSYIFTPDPIAFPCALPQTLVVTIDPLVTPAFIGIPTIVCQGAAAPVLPLSSSNVTPITGTWSPATVDTSILGSVVYTFTPTVGQCASVTLSTTTVTILANVTPDFPVIAPFCSGTAAPVLTNISPNGITGSWSPAIISNTVSGNYLFTPNANQCSATQTLSVTVNPIVTPLFPAVAPICSGAVLAALPTISTNGIAGSWSPALDNSSTTLYTFTPSVGQCASTANLTITVNPILTPAFTIVTTYCSGAIIPALPLTSINGVTGTWSPALNNLATTLYTFTPTLGQCANPATETITINPNVTPDFTVIAPFCSGTTAPILTNISPNGITGTWFPATISNTVNGNYLFTPSPNQCSATQSLSVTINPRTVPNFAVIPAFCSGTIAPVLTNVSPNGITGTWSPSTISNTNSGSYIFTPLATECATIQTLNVTVNTPVTPSFVDLTFCSGSLAPILNTISPNGISGTWLPTVVNNTTSGTYVFTPNSPQCASIKTINVTVSPINIITSLSWTVSDAFADNQIVTIIATGAGNYIYQLDDGPFQSSPIFENVALGLHSITVKDINGCGFPITDNNVLIISFPKYFTPNSDGYNDNWNISDISNKLNSRIYIFDRYGKFLKELSPLGLGWNGTYNGQPMPANDYWFTIEYTEDNISKIFRSHFSLKR